MATAQTKNNLNFDNLYRFLDLLYAPFRELWLGFRIGTIPVGNCLLAGVVATLTINVGLDHYIWSLLKLESLYPESLIAYCLYYYFWLLSGFIAWSVLQCVLRRQLIERLTDVFISAKLRSPRGRLPGFLYDRSIDEYSRVMCLAKNTIAKSRFDEAKDDLESGLQVYIDKIQDDVKNGLVRIFYSHQPMPELVTSKEVDARNPLTIPIGKTRASEITTSLKDSPHMLIGGTSGYGKSTFLRQAITTLYLNNKDLEFYLFDFKFGMEFQMFDNLPRVEVFDEFAKAVNFLKKQDPDLEFRGRLMRQLGCTEFSQIHQISDEELSKKNFDPKEVRSLKRKIIVIDEIAEVTLGGIGHSSEQMKTAKRVLSRIARLGRAGGIHLILATQRPDIKAVDGQIKTNLSARLAFYMSDQASSRTILDLARASDLPDIKGRAIWKVSKPVEVQTPFQTEKETEALLKPFYRTEKSVSSREARVTKKEKFNAMKKHKDLDEVQP